MDAFIHGIKSVLDWGANTTPQNNFTCRPSLDTIKQHVIDKNFKSLANDFSALCGPYGRAQIIEFNGNAQIHFLFDSQKERDTFKQTLKEHFDPYHDDILTFEDFQTQTDPQEVNLYPLKLKASQSTTLLYEGSYDFSDAQNILRETKIHLDSTKNTLLDITVLNKDVEINPANSNGLNEVQIIPFNTNINSKWNIDFPNILLTPHEKNLDFIRLLGSSWLPLNSVSNYAKTCQGAFQFIMKDFVLWSLFASSQKIQPSPSIHPRLQVMGDFALKKAEFFEEKYHSVKWDETRHSNPEKSANFAKAAKYYITAAELGVAEAIKWLEAAVISEEYRYSSALKGEMYLALGDVYAKANADDALVKKYHTVALKLLTEGAEKGDSRAILILYDRSIGDKPAGENNHFLETLLLARMGVAASLPDPQNKEAIGWILGLFSEGAKLPAFYKEKTEQALLAALNGIGFSGSYSGYCAFNMFRYECHEYDQVRLLIETKLNKLFGTQDNPIALHFEATSHNHKTILIIPKKKDDEARFTTAVTNSAVAAFFSPLTHLSPGFPALTYENSIKLDNESWDKFKALLSR